MRVRVLFFGMLRDITGGSAETIELPDESSVADLLARCGSKNARLKECLGSLAVAVNQRYADPSTKLQSGDEVALLPPVSGGAPESRAGNSARSRAAIVRERIDTQGVLAGLKCGEDGAAVVFEGVVRNQTRGRRTLYLEYEAYEEMALHEMESLAAQALDRFQIRDVALVHRLGRLESARPVC